MPLTVADLLRWEQAKDVDKFAQIICFLDDEAHRDVWLYALAALDHIHMAETIPLLLQAAGSCQDSAAKQKVEEVLVRWGQEVIAPLLTVGLDPQETTWRRYTALHILRSFDDPRILDAYLTLLKADKRMSKSIIRWIQEMPDHEPLYAAVLATDPQRRASAVKALQGQADEPRAWELTTKALKDECVEVRISAAATLSEMMDYWQRKDTENREDFPVPVVDALIDKTRDEDSIVRRLAAQCLIGIRDPRVMAATQALLVDPDDNVRITAIRAYACYPNADVCERLKAIFSDTQEAEQVRSFVLETIANNMPDEAANFLIDIAGKEEDPSFRQIAIGGLRGVKCSQALELLLACLDDQNPDIVSAALITLYEWGDPTLVESLLVHFDRTQDAHTITTYCHVFGGIKDRRTLIPMLRKVAGLEKRAVRRVVQAIATVLDPETLQDWLEKLDIGGDPLLAQGIELIKQYLNALPPTHDAPFLDQIIL